MEFFRRSLTILVLTRKPGETIRIGDDIVITISQLKGGRVRVGIDAPEEIAIVRGELYVPEQRPQQLLPPSHITTPPNIVMGFAGAA